LAAPALIGAVGLALIVSYVAGSGGRSAEWLIALGSMFAALVVATAAVVYRPARPVPWALLAIGFVIAGGGTVAMANEWFGSTGLVVPGGMQAIGLLAYPSLFVGITSVSSDRRHARDLLAGAEPIIYAIALTALVWLSVTGPYLDDETMPLQPEAWIWVFPLLDGVLALIALRRFGRAKSGHMVFGLLALGLLLWGAAHALVTWAAYEQTLVSGSLTAGSLMLGPVVIAMALTVPGVRGLTAVSGEQFRVHWSQIFGLMFAAIVPLGALIVMLATGLSSRSSFVVVTVATASVIVLALARMGRLVDQVRLLTEQRGHDRLAAMVEHSSDVVLLADPNGKVGYASPGLRATLGLDPESWSGRHVFDIIDEADRDDANRQLARLVEFGNGGTVEFETTLVHADGQRRKATAVAANLVGGSAVDGIVATFRDVTEQRNLERQLSHRAFHDELTGLANRALFLDRMDHALRITRAESDPVVVLFVDLDDFKSVNDVLGHAVGDQLLKLVAERIRAAAGTGDTAARLGGDEFAILLEDRGGIDRAIDVGERLLDSLREPMSIAGYEVAVLASIGVAVAAAGMSTTSLLRDADIAMYEAKRSGKGQIRIFDPAMRLEASRHLEYRGELADALHNGQLSVVYLPYVDLTSGQVTGAEALMRWDHPERGELEAADFVPIAERSGLILPLGEWVLEQSLQALAGWRPGLMVSVNISAAQIRQPDFVEQVVESARLAGVDRSRVVLEVTETTLVDEGERATDAVASLRALGFQVALDDFGAGLCSLSYLQRHPIDLLKLDRSVVDEITTGGGPGLAATILQMANTLELTTVGEGIETRAQLQELRRLGCTLGQGHVLSYPLDAAEIAERFSAVEPATGSAVDS
jgi:diguanylate cyclase (GGDEF)-like protein/PAS domain S-box-containing protein